MKASRKLLQWFGVALAFALALSGCAENAEDCGQLPQLDLQGNAGCLIVRPGAAVMIQQRLNNTWALPGGTAKTAERAACTAQRETGEETGLQVQVTAHLVTLENGFHLFLCQADASGEMLPQDTLEIQAVEWKSRIQRANLNWRFPQQRELVESLIQQYE